MKALMDCLFRVCCDSEEESDDEESSSSRHATNIRRAAGPARMTRRVAPEVVSTSTEFQSTTAAHQSHGELGAEDEVCCQPGVGDNAHARRIQDFLRKLSDGWRQYDSLSRTEPAPGAQAPGSSGQWQKEETRGPLSWPLRAASKFESTEGLPTINPDEVVLPGSALQKEMSLAMSRNLEEQGDECVICMEPFDETNPRMPTLCGCGENKASFHLPCLYQWIEQSRDCPSCRTRLRWEEF